ncbi:MAG: SDR family oxidoreductase [Chloroherpetonaceae bacterium]|nr:SDR family oxidoreductase [Chthonomonadaceae bacterium]MDW8206253.1 SDR family oxidoreductase [Chloroherpetonaceae bacterium]
MHLGLDGKIALVTAASKGLGFAAALALAREGVQIAICSRSEQNIHNAASQIRELTGESVLPIVADVTRPEDVARSVQETVDHFGGLHILVCNSGGPPAGTFESLEEAQWQQALDSTLFSTTRLIRSALPHLRGWGRIIVITSTSVKQPIPGLLLSNTIRAGIVGLCKTLSQEFAPYGITVNNVAPGSFDTDRLRMLHERQARAAGISLEEARRQAEARIPLGRLGRPEELAHAIVFLASEAASYITGQTLIVDGGQTLGI